MENALYFFQLNNSLVQAMCDIQCRKSVKLILQTFGCIPGLYSVLTQFTPSIFSSPLPIVNNYRDAAKEGLGQGCPSELIP